MTVTVTQPTDGATWADIFADPADVRRVPWARGSLHFAAAPATTSLLGFQKIDDWIRYRQVRYPQFQVNAPSGGVPPTLFTEPRDYLALTMQGAPVVERIAAQLRNGATLRFVDLEDWHPRIAEICAGLAAELSCIVRAYAFYTSGGDDGVHAHWDDADIFALQVEGTKTWKLWDVPADGDWPAGQTIDPSIAPDRTIELAPGDGLYIPAGMGHQAAAGPEGSLHLSIALRPPTHRDIARIWAEQVLAAFPASARLPVIGDRTAAVKEILEQAIEAGRAIDPVQVAATADHIGADPVSDAPLIAGAVPRSGRPTGHTGPEA